MSLCMVDSKADDSSYSMLTCPNACGPHTVQAMTWPTAEGSSRIDLELDQHRHSEQEPAAKVSAATLTQCWAVSCLSLLKRSSSTPSELVRLKAQ